MFRLSLLIFLRNFKRNKGASLINLFGLSIGLASALLIYLWVNDELNVDQFNERDSKRHYQVLVNGKSSTGIQTSDTAPPPLAKAIEETFPEVERAIPMVENSYNQGILSFDDKFLRAIPKFVGEGYLDVFECNFVSGNKEVGLSDMKDILISEKLATGLFGDSDVALGKTVMFKARYFTGSYNITGVFASSKNTSSEFDILFSFETFLAGRPGMNEWRQGGAQIHLVLQEGVDIDRFNEKLKDFLGTQKKTTQTLFAQKYSEKYLYGKYENGFPVAGRMVYVRIFSLIAIFVLIIACINYMNLSTAQAARRIKEIGVKKAVGAQRKALIYQYFGESVFMTFFSLILSIGIIALLLPQFNLVTGKEITIYSTIGAAVPIVIITFLTGLISGIYPGLYLSSFRTVLALKGKVSAGSGGLWLRKGLVVFQFAISVILIVSVIIIYKQIDFIQNSNLGYDKEHIISFRQEGELKNNHEAFMTEVRNNPGIVNISYMYGSLGQSLGGGSNFRWKDQDPEERRIQFYYIEGGYDMADLLEVELIQGRFLSKDFPTDNKSIVINETAAATMGYENPIGERFGKRDLYTIVGVVKDFHFQGMHEEIKPFFFQPATRGSSFMVKIRGENQAETLNRIQEIHDSFNPGYPFEFKFVDENYQRLYDEERRIATLSRYFAGIAIAISCLGLLALTAFSTQQRSKEIAIRKILGSSSIKIISLLSREFIFLVLLAIIIALPVGYYLMKNWLEGFAYGISLSPVYFAMAGGVILLIAWITIMIQTAKSAVVNVTTTLRRE